MSINSYEVDEQKNAGRNYGLSYNGYAMMYRQAIQDHSYKRAKEVEADLKRMDEQLAKEGEQ